MKTIMNVSHRLAGLLGLTALMTLTGRAAAGSDPPQEPPPEAPPKGSLATMAPLGKGRVGMSVGGGVAVLLPFYSIEAGVGLGSRVDLMGRLESEVGMLHYPSLGLRASPATFGAWTLGLAFAVNYSFFGIKTDQVNLTSTFYFSASAGVSRPVTRSTDFMADVTGELDLFDYEELDGEGGVKGNVHYDATILRLGMKTRLTEDLDGFLRARVRIPIETLVYEAMSFYVIPSIEVGGTFVF